MTMGIRDPVRNALHWVRDLVNSVRLGFRFPGLRLERNVHLPTLRGLTVGEGSILREDVDILLPSAGPPATIELGRRTKVGRRCQFGVAAGEHIRIGDYSSLHSNCIILGDVTIGRYCLISVGVFISSGDHSIHLKPWRLIREQDKMAADPSAAGSKGGSVQVGDDCWLGWGAVIRKGLYIGKGAVVGANSVVTRDVAPYTIVAGNPANKIGGRLDFRPPEALSADDETQHPYFYSGFMLHTDATGRSTRDGALWGDSRVCLVLAAPKSHRQIRVQGEVSRGGHLESVILNGHAQGDLPSHSRFDATFTLPENPPRGVPAVLQEYLVVEMRASSPLGIREARLL